MKNYSFQNSSSLDRMIPYLYAQDISTNLVHHHIFPWTPMCKVIDRVQMKNLQFFIQNNQGMGAPLCTHTRNSGPRMFSGVKSLSRPEAEENSSLKIQKHNLQDAVILQFSFFLNVLSSLKLLCASFV